MLRIFISYSHKDKDFREELEVHLAPTKRRRHIDVWTDCNIVAGKDIDREILHKLDGADIVLLLVSPDFLASNYCCLVEMDRAMKRHEDGKAYVVPVILRHCNWSGEVFAGLRATPQDAKPITTWTHRDEAYLDVVQQVNKVLDMAAAEKSMSEVQAAAPSANGAAIAASAPDKTLAFVCSSPTSVTAETIVFDYSTNNGKLRIDRSGKIFDMKFSKANATSIHLYRSGATRRIARDKSGAIDVPTTIDDKETTSDCYTIQTGEGFLVENEAGDVFAAQIIDIKDDSRGADRDEINFLFTICGRRT